jgi:hypothetical protein
MEVITENPIIYIGANDTYEADIFLSLDGKSSSVEIEDFQNYVNNVKGGKLDPDRKWGKKTQEAWDKYGKEFEEYYYGKPSLKTGKSVADSIKEGGIVGPKVEPTPAQKLEAKKKGLTWDSAKKVYVQAQELGIVDALLGKLGITPRTSTPPVGLEPTLDPSGSASDEGKGMSTTTKILIGVGALAVVGLIIYSSSSKTPKGK